MAVPTPENALRDSSCVWSTEKIRQKGAEWTLEGDSEARDA